MRHLHDVGVKDMAAAGAQALEAVALTVGGCDAGLVQQWPDINGSSFLLRLGFFGHRHRGWLFDDDGRRRRGRYGLECVFELARLGCRGHVQRGVAGRLLIFESLERQSGVSLVDRGRGDSGGGDEQLLAADQGGGGETSKRPEGGRTAKAHFTPRPPRDVEVSFGGQRKLMNEPPWGQDLAAFTDLKWLSS